jgi:hypothetical protein
MMEPSTLKSTLYRNKESKHHEYNRKNQESRMLHASNARKMCMTVLVKKQMMKITAATREG